MKLVNAANMRAIDAETIKTLGIPGEQLMERAGTAVAELMLEGLIEKPDQTSVAVFCGTGNNGGDGYVIARQLAANGVDISIFYLGPIDKLTPDARLNYYRVAKLGLPLTEIKTIADLPEELECDFVIDAIFGTGFAGTPRDLSAELIEQINLCDAEVIAVDIPSGLNADNGQFEGAVVEANFTFPLALPKIGLYLSPGRELSGMVKTVPIGIPDNVIEAFGLKDELITPEDISELLPFRKTDGHKGDFGKLFALAGSTGMTGAAALTSQAAYRSGCGTVRLGCPVTVQPILASMLVETMAHPLPDVGKKGMLALRGLGEVRKLALDADAIVIGPGLGLHHETGDLLRRFISTNDRPLLIDADALTHIAKDLECIKTTKAQVVLTPHPGEFARLLGREVATDFIARVEQARKFAVEFGVILVLKGSPTVIADPNGIVYFNQTGNSGMATGGSGDVLSGMIGSFMAQGLSTVEAAQAGVFIHGLCGDMAVETIGERSLIASDLIRALPQALQFIEGLAG